MTVKKVKILLVATLALLNVSVFAQTKSDNFKVYGNCDMCKERIEKASKVDGVKKTFWNVETKLFTVIYDSTVVKKMEIEKAIAAAGHDTENITASPEVYKKIPACCKYERKSANTKTKPASPAENHSGHHH